MSVISRFSSEVLGFDLWPRQADILDAICGEDVRTAVLRLGRRSGKGRMAAPLGTYEATVNAPTHLAHVPEGERVGIAIAATSQQQARVTHRFISGWLRGSELASLIVRDTADEIELANGMSILTMPSTARSTRGYAIAVVVMDEAAWMLDAEGSVNGARELYGALAPATAMFPEGKVLILGTPRYASGFFYDMCQREDVREWHASTRDVNPLITDDFLAAEEAADPAYFAREYLAEFTASVGAVFPEDFVRRAVYEGEPATNGRYLISLDASSATGKDTFACLLGDIERDRLTVRSVRGWTGTAANPASHRAILDEVADLARRHHAPIVVDQWASEPTRQALVERGCTVRPFAWTNESKEEAVTIARRLLYEDRLAILKHRTLISELVTLERTQLPSGRSRYAAPGDRHDDYATALLALARSAFGDPWLAISGPFSSIA
jgi:hypothetical protein